MRQVQFYFLIISILLRRILTSANGTISFPLEIGGKAVDKLWYADRGPTSRVMVKNGITGHQLQIQPEMKVTTSIFLAEFLFPFEEVHLRNQELNYDPKILVSFSLDYSIEFDEEIVRQQLQKEEERLLLSLVNLAFEFKLGNYVHSSLSSSLQQVTSAGSGTHFQKLCKFGITRSHRSILPLEFTLILQMRSEDHEKYLKLSSQQFLKFLISCSMNLHNISFHYLEQPLKITAKIPSITMNQQDAKLNLETGTSLQSIYSNYCLLLGTTNALILNMIQIHNMRISYDDYVTQREKHDFNRVDDQKISVLKGMEQIHPSPRILCNIFTISSREEQIKAIYETWGKSGHQIIFFSNHTDEKLHTVTIHHYGEESYENMYQKTIAMMKYIYHHFVQSCVKESIPTSSHDQLSIEDCEYDWFLFGGDDFYVIMENLINFLQSDPIISESMYSHRKPLYLGRKLTYPTHFYSKKEPYRDVDYLQFNSGGSGYLLNIYALKLLGEKILQDDIFDEDYSHNNDQCFFNITNSNEDYYIANCLYRLGVYPIDTSEHKVIQTSDLSNFSDLEPNSITTTGETVTNYLHRFHLLIPGFYYHSQELFLSSLFYHYDNQSRIGKDSCCSVDTISFHQIDATLMRMIDNYLYHCPIELKYAYYCFHSYNHSYFETDIKYKHV